MKQSQYLLAGALLALSFEPVALPGLGILSIAWLFCAQPERSFLQGWLYGIGFFGVGVSWIFISIHSYGHADYWLAALLTFLFTLFMGLYFALFLWSFHIVFRKSTRLLYSSQLSFRCGAKRSEHRTENSIAKSIQALGFSTGWVLFEYLRANLFTGFPWLLLGYSQTVTPMKYLAPIFGVYGVSFLMVFSGCLLGIGWELLREKNKWWSIPVGFMLLLYVLPQCLAPIHWTKTRAQPVPVSVIQGNINENEKWVPGAYQKTLRRYVQLTQKVPRKSRIIIWPEGAIPIPYPQARFFLNPLSRLIKNNHATLVAGIPYAHETKREEYYNALIVLGNSSGHYFKHHLVPFGEYLPASLFRDGMEFLKIPVYETLRGKFYQPLLNIENILTLPFICYEIAYADILFNALPKVELLLTISDDAWFGHSMARAQHLQIAEMRSLQSGRYQIMATNNGISAIINAAGEIINSVPSFETRILNGEISPMTGSTPWSKVGDNPIVLFVAIGWIICVIGSIKRL